MLYLFRKRRTIKIVSLWLLGSMVGNLILPNAAYALTSGPTTPEVSSFTPISTSDLVNVATGDFTYNIPLLDIEGYPVNLSYDAGIGPDQEASCVGLGWNLNIGALNRNMRGLPDDFSGDEVEKEMNIKDNITAGLTGGLRAEIAGVNPAKASLNASLYYNNYRGLGGSLSAGFHPEFTIAKISSTKNTALLGGLDLGLSFDSQEGIGSSSGLSLSFDKKILDECDDVVGGSKYGLNVGTSYNSQTGLKDISLGFSISDKKQHEKKQATNLDASFMVGGPTYTPYSSMAFNTVAVSLTGSMGLEPVSPFSLPAASLTGYYTQQYLTNKSKSSPSFGYYYTENAKDNEEGLLDFNREKDNPFISKATCNLPLTNMTYDVFSATGQGISGGFRPYRSDVPIMGDPLVKNTAHNGSVGVEVSGGNTFHTGVNVSYHNNTSRSGKWKTNQGIASKIGTNVGLPATQNPSYFKQMGEMTEIDQDFYTNIGGEKVVKVDLVQGNDLPDWADRFSLAPNAGNLNNSARPTVSLPNGPIVKTKKDKRTTFFQPLTAKEAAAVGVHKEIGNYTNMFTLTNNPSNAYTPTNIARNSGYRKDHHFSEVSVTRTDGARYVYGIPAYNTLQKDVSFNVEGNPVTGNMVSYTPTGANPDNSTNNKKGIDYYYVSTKVPSYTYTYHLTDVLSADYVDSDNIVGPSDNDGGTWHKINYSKLPYNLNWRSPLEANQAMLNKGVYSDVQDDKASYVYGEKEIWYAHSIVSRHYVAEFVYNDVASPRQDALGVLGENGGKDASKPLKRLEKIVLYAKESRIDANGNVIPTAVPVKTVHFRYDYTLCAGISNSSTNAGKLTLIGLSFSYGNSGLAKLSEYTFKYNASGNTALSNPVYGINTADIWGNYKPIASNKVPYSPSTAVLPINEFPYTLQNTATLPTNGNTDTWASAWCLSEIKTPSNATIQIKYEADDYAYVQDQKAMQMFVIEGVGDETTKDINNRLYYNDNTKWVNNYYLYLRVPTLPSTNMTKTEAFRKYYFNNNLQYLSFQMFTNTEKATSSSFPLGEGDYINGYAEIDWGVNSSPEFVSSQTGYDVVKLKLLSTTIQDFGAAGIKEQIQPMVQTGFNFIRDNLNSRVYPGSVVDNGSTNVVDLAKQMILSLAGTVNQVRTIVDGYNRTLREIGFCKYIKPERSWVRLYNPMGKKKGGGIRVKEIKTIDNWKEMAEQPTATGTTNFHSNQEYVQQFEYTTTDQDGRSISSGVAAYEPSMGEENPLRTPYKSFDKKTTA